MITFRTTSLIHLIGYLSTTFLTVYGATALIRDTTGHIRAENERAAMIVSAKEEVQANNAVPLLQESANIPQLISFQGALRDQEGHPLTEAYTMTFRIYDDLQAQLSEAIWSETRGGVVVEDGQFELMLGDRTPITPSLFNGPNRYIGVTVRPSQGGDPIIEDNVFRRLRFASVPYGLYSEYAYALSASGGDPQRVLHVDSEGTVRIENTPRENTPHAELTIIGDGEPNILLENHNVAKPPYPIGRINRWNNRLEILSSDIIDLAINSEGDFGGTMISITDNNIIFGGDFGRPDGGTTLSLFGSRIGDEGGGILFIRSGGGIVAFDGEDKVGIGTTNPSATLDVNGGLNIQGSELSIGRNNVQNNLIETDTSGNLNLRPVKDDAGGVIIRDGNTHKGIRLEAGSSNTIQSVDIDGTSPFPLILQDSGSRVGIGTREPQAVLDVNGDVNVGGDLMVNGITVKEKPILILRFIQPRPYSLGSDGSFDFDTGISTNDYHCVTTSWRAGLEGYRVPSSNPSVRGGQPREHRIWISDWLPTWHVRISALHILKEDPPSVRPSVDVLCVSRSIVEYREIVSDH